MSVTGTDTASTVASISDQRVVEIAHQRRARLPAGHVPRRATHVDVDDGRAGSFGDARALRHPARLAARELHDVNASALPFGAQARVGAAFAASASLAVISETTRPAPSRATSRRNGASVTPDIGAKITALGSVRLPIVTGPRPEKSVNKGT